LTNPGGTKKSRRKTTTKGERREEREIGTVDHEKVEKGGDAGGDLKNAKKKEPNESRRGNACDDRSEKTNTRENRWSGNKKKKKKSLLEPAENTKMRKNLGGGERDAPFSGKTENRQI